MFGIGIDQMWHAIRMIGMLFILVAAAVKIGGGGGDMLIDPSTLEVGSPDWAQYVREHFNNLNM